jgi:hypothetical protein
LFGEGRATTIAKGCLKLGEIAARRAVLLQFAPARHTKNGSFTVFDLTLWAFHFNALQ